MDNKLLVICGPTATGKTKLAFKLAKKFNGEIISADSRQVYKGLDILTGKDIPNEVKSQKSKVKIKYKTKSYQLPFYEINGIKLWMYDVVNIDEEFSVGHYQSLVSTLIKDIQQRRKLPIVTGGTGLYLRSLTQTLTSIHIPPDKTLRQKLYQKSVGELQSELQKIDRERWESLNNSDRNNPRRLVRAIEITTFLYQGDVRKEMLCGRLSAKNGNHNKQSDVFWIGLTAPISMLKQRIKARVEERWQAGALAEVGKLTAAAVNFPIPILGLKPVQGYLAKKLNAEQVKDEWANSEFAYAKRQITWFKKQPEINWFDISVKGWPGEVGREVKKWYTSGK